MAHKNGNKYQIRIVREDGAEELSAWMHSIEEVAKAMILARKAQIAGFWCEALPGPTARTGNRFWNIPLWIPRLHDTSRTTPVFCRKWSRGTGKLWALKNQSIGLESDLDLPSQGLPKLLSRLSLKDSQSRLSSARRRMIARISSDQSKYVSFGGIDAQNP